MNGTNASGVEVSPHLAVVDGLNVILSHGKCFPDLRILLAVIRQLLRTGHDVLVITDAKARHCLREGQGSSAVEIYEGLLATFPNHFKQSQPGVKADPLILRQAETHNAIVVSCDRFQQDEYQSRFQWLRNPNRFLRVAAIRGHFYFNEQGYVLPQLLQTLAEDVSAMLRQMEHSLRSRRGEAE
jgi:hypothetical protein